jgi:hypothetical protein
MANDTTQPDWTPRIIAAFAIVLALGGGASFVAGAIRTAPAVSVTTTCAGFAADALQAVDSAGSASGPDSSTEPPTPKYKESTTSGVARGDIDGITRLDIDVEVAAAGDGAITISQRGTLLLAVSQRVAIASCTAAKQVPAPSSGDVSSNGSTRSLSAPLG